MMHVESFAVPAQATFGRDGAMFNSLLDFVAQLSVVLWALVILTAVIRFVGIRIYRRGADRRPLLETVAPSTAVPVGAVPNTTAGKVAVPVPAGRVDGAFVDVLTAVAATNAAFDEVLQPAEAPAAVVAVTVTRCATRQLRAAPWSASYVPAAPWSASYVPAAPWSASYVPAFAAISTDA